MQYVVCHFYFCNHPAGEVGAGCFSSLFYINHTVSSPSYITYNIINMSRFVNIVRSYFFSYKRRKERGVCCFTFSVFLMSCYCYRSLPLLHDTVGWPVVCDSSISWSNSLTFRKSHNF